MADGEAERLLEVLDLFVENERAIGRYYGLCKARLPQFCKEWAALEEAEERHAQVFERIRAAAAEQPLRWKPGRFQAEALRTMIADIRRECAALEKPLCNRRHAISFITDVEKSLIETAYFEAVRADDPVWGGLIGTLREETAGHKNLLVEIGARFDAAAK